MRSEDRLGLGCVFSSSSRMRDSITGTTTIEFVLPQAGDVEIGVYDVSGRRVATQHLTQATAGSHSVMMSSNAIDGTPLPSGVYFCRVRAGAETVTKKMVIAR